MNVTGLDHVQKETSRTVKDSKGDFLPQALMLLGFVSLIFAAMPDLDLIVSRLFWDPAAGFGFKDNSLLIAIRDANRILPWVVIGIVTTLLLSLAFFRKLKCPPHKLLFVLAFFAAGPGLCVNLIKMLVGRARPRALEEFGGSAFFTPPWQITDQCVHNCSFISGESASAFALLTLVVFINPRYATLYVGAVGFVAAIFSFNRVAFGAHFLSDVVLTWNVMFVLATLLWRAFSRNASRIDALFARGSHRT
jgi:membrane-associated PAP2 superfamily phosphatase